MMTREELREKVARSLAFEDNGSHVTDFRFRQADAAIRVCLEAAILPCVLEREKWRNEEDIAVALDDAANYARFQNVVKNIETQIRALMPEE